MMKILGSLLVFGGSGLLWWFQRQERCSRRNTLADLMLVLRNLQDGIRMTRAPLPELLETLAKDCGTETAGLLRDMAAAAGKGTDVNAVWHTGIGQLPLLGRERDFLRSVSFTGDEEKVCKELALALYGLAQRAEELERGRPEEEKRAAALCFSGAALMVILLI